MCEKVEDRLFVAAMAALTPSGLLLGTDDPLDAALFADANADEDLFQSDVETPGSFTFAALAPATEPDPSITLAPEDDPLSPAGDPAGGGGGDLAVAAAGPGSVTVSVRTGCSSATEANPAAAGHFTFSAQAGSYGSTPPTTVTVSYALSGTATAVTRPGTGADYSGPLMSGSVTIPLVNGSGNKSVSYNAIDEWIDEPAYESVIVTMESGTSDTGAPVGFGTNPASNTVFSGDYTLKFLTGPDFNNQTSATSMSVGLNQTKQIGVQVFQNGARLAGVNVTLRVSNAYSGTNAVILDDSQSPPAEVYSLVRPTLSDGVAYFTIMGKSRPTEEGPNFKNQVDFTAQVTNAENRLQDEVLPVSVSS